MSTVNYVVLHSNGGAFHWVGPDTGRDKSKPRPSKGGKGKLAKT
jgi:hypothetical protein